MNYLSEIIAFTEWKEVNQLPASAIALWYELMAICNKTGWRQEFTVPNGLLQIRAGLSRKEFDRARQLLIQAGRIVYKKSNRVNQAGRYEIIPFVQKGQREGQQEGQQEGQREGQQTAHRRGNERGTLFKLKLNETKTYKDDQENAPNNQQIANEKVPYKKIVDLYNSTCVSLSKVQKITETRKRHIKARWNGDITLFENVFSKAEQSDFLTGRKPSKKNPTWKADFDWLMNEHNMTKVLEGKYTNKAGGGNGGRAGPPEKDTNADDFFIN